MTPLQHAVSGGNLPALRYLLDKGADLNLASHQKGEEAITALHTAAEKGMSSMKTISDISIFSSCDYLASFLCVHYVDRPVFCCIIIQLYHNKKQP